MLPIIYLHYTTITVLCSLCNCRTHHRLRLVFHVVVSIPVSPFTKPQSNIQLNPPLPLAVNAFKDPPLPQRTCSRINPNLRCLRVLLLWRLTRMSFSLRLRFCLFLILLFWCLLFLCLSLRLGCRISFWHCTEFSTLTALTSLSTRQMMPRAALPLAGSRTWLIIVIKYACEDTALLLWLLWLWVVNVDIFKFVLLLCLRYLQRSLERVRTSRRRMECSTIKRGARTPFERLDHGRSGRDILGCESGIRSQVDMRRDLNLRMTSGKNRKIPSKY